MTAQSPAPVRVFVIGAGPSDLATDVATAVEALRAGRGSRATIGSGLLTDCLILEAGRVPPEGTLAEVRGFARTTEQPQINGDLQPARALRRALADGRMSAADIAYACAFELGSISDSRAMAALERGLGRFAAATVLEVAPDPLVRCARAVTGSDGSVGGALALVINPGFGSIAVAFGRP